MKDDFFSFQNKKKWIFFPLALAISFKLYYNEILLKNVTANGIKTISAQKLQMKGEAEWNRWYI